MFALHLKIFLPHHGMFSSCGAGLRQWCPKLGYCIC